MPVIMDKTQSCYDFHAKPSASGNVEELLGDRDFKDLVSRLRQYFFLT